MAEEEEQQMGGIMKLTIVDGRLKRDTEIMGKMSPYVTLVFNGHKYKTKVHDSAGKSPVWGDQFTLEITNSTEEILMCCWDEDLTTSDKIGFTKMKVSSLMFNNGTDDWHTITFDNENAGEIHVVSEFEPEGGDRYENMKADLEA